jgi:hypothetical protein
MNKDIIMLCLLKRTCQLPQSGLASAEEPANKPNRSKSRRHFVSGD